MDQLTIQTTANLIAYFEQYIGIAEWDVNAYRLGFGSDTEGPDQVRVTQHMTTTKSRALQNLMLRVPQFLEKVQVEVGPELFAKLGVNTIAALGSLAYNYGSVPDNVLWAIKTSPARVGAAIRARQYDNGGINSWRRNGEAACAALDGGQY